MWVYQQPANTEPKPLAALPAPAAPAKRAGERVPFQKGETASPARASKPIRTARGQEIPRACAALAAAYLFGTLLSGAALALCRAGEQAFFSAWMDSWASLFVLDGPGAVWTLFGAEYLTVALGAALLLLAGLSAAGPVLIYLFAMLFGLGVGAAGLQLLLSAGWQSALPGLLLGGAPAAAAVTALCLFGASALAVSSRLQQAAFGRQAAPVPGTARALLVQYLALNLLFLPLCGVSTALACLAGQL